MERADYTVDTIGANTLVGMLCRKSVDGTYTIDNIADKEVIVHYSRCHMSYADFANELRKLYERGANRVTLVNY